MTSRARFASAAAILLATIVAPAASMGSDRASEKVAANLARGRAMLGSGQPAEALVAFTRASKAAGGGSVEAWLGISEAAIRTGDYERGAAAAEEAESLAAMAQQRVQALNWRGMALVQTQVPGVQRRTGARARGSDSSGLEEAEAAYRLALELSGGAMNAIRFNLADAISWSIRTAARRSEALALIDEYLARGVEPERAVRAKELRAWIECVSTADGDSPVPEAAFEKRRVKPPRGLSTSRPEYTEEARQARVQGLAILRAIIDEEGRVACAHVARGLPHGLDAAALEAVRDWRFEPARLDGQPVAVFYHLRINFKLQ